MSSLHVLVLLAAGLFYCFSLAPPVVTSAAAGDAAAAGVGGAGAADDFASKAADAIDNTLLTFKNSISSMFEDGSKLGSFFANVTTHFKKLTGEGEKEST